VPFINVLNPLKMHLHKQKLTKYFRGHYIIMGGVTNFKELGVTFSCSVFAAFFWELPKNFPHVCEVYCQFIKYLHIEYLSEMILAKRE
jgi:hypothetical protein